MLTQEDKDGIRYSWENSGDITQWHDWEDKKDLVEDEFPHLIAAIHKLAIAERTLNAIIRDSCN